MVHHDTGGEGPGVDELTMTYEVRRHTTVMTVTGVVDADRSTDLDDGLEMARTLRQRGPIVVDLSGVEAIAASALLSLMQAVQKAERADRALTVRGLFPVKILSSQLSA